MLDFKGIPYQVRNYNGLSGMAAARLSDVGKLPVLDLQGQRVQDSTRIAHFLDERFPDAPRLFPSDPKRLAQVELWEDWADEVLFWFEVHFRVRDPEAFEHFLGLMTEGRPGWERLPMRFALKSVLGSGLKGQGIGRMPAKQVHADFARHLDRIELTLSDTGWLVGDSATVADMAVGAQLMEVIRTSRLRDDILRRPHLAAWVGRLRQLAP